MSESVAGTERVINVTDIDPRRRHTIIFQLFDHLPAEDSLQLVVDHDPKPLRFQFEAKHGSRCQMDLSGGGARCLAVRLRLGRRSDTEHA
jgi:uncharacterized protein (DUF2249 family)